MKKFALLLAFTILATSLFSQAVTFDTIVFKRGGKIYRLILYTDSLKINSTMFYTNHSKSEDALWIDVAGQMHNKNTKSTYITGGTYCLPGSGDNNGDGVLGGGDVTRLRGWLINTISLTNSQLAACDIDGDGKITYGDLGVMRARIANIGGWDIDNKLNIARNLVQHEPNKVYLSGGIPYVENYNSGTPFDVETGGSVRIPNNKRLYFGGRLSDGDSTVSIYNSGATEMTIDAPVLKLPSLPTATASKILYFDPTSKALTYGDAPAMVTPADKLLHWDGTQYLPYTARKSPDPGYPYFYTQSGAFDYPKYNGSANTLFLDGPLIVNRISGGDFTAPYYSIFYVWPTYIGMSMKNGNYTDYHLLNIDEPSTKFWLTSYGQYGTLSRSNPISIGDNTTYQGRVNEHIIIDPANTRFDINMTKTRFNKGTAGKYLYLDANKEVSYVDLPATMPYPGSGIPVSTGSAWGTSIAQGTTSQYLRGDFTWQNLPAPTTYSAGYGLGMSGTTLFNARYQKNIDTVDVSYSGLLQAQSGVLSPVAGGDGQDMLYMINEQPAFVDKGNVGDVLMEVDYGGTSYPMWQEPPFVTDVTVTTPLYLVPDGGRPHNRDLHIYQADASQSGFLSSTDWNTFNNKVSSPWTLNGSSTYYNGGNVGIGTSSPGDKLALVGTSSFSDNMKMAKTKKFYFDGGTDDYAYQPTTDVIDIVTGGIQKIRIRKGTNSLQVGNDTTDNGNYPVSIVNDLGSAIASIGVTCWAGTSGSTTFLQRTSGGATVGSFAYNLADKALAGIGSRVSNDVGWVTTNANKGNFVLKCNGNHSATNFGTYWQFNVTALNSTAAASEVMRVDGEGSKITGSEKFVKVTSTPTVGTSETAIYVKGNYYVVAYNDAGTMKYRYMDLTSTNATWTYSTTAP